MCVDARWAAHGNRPEAWWAALWPQRRFDTNTSNDSFILAGVLSRRRHLLVYPLNRKRVHLVAFSSVKKNQQVTHNHKNGELICLLGTRNPACKAESQDAANQNSPIALFCVGCQLPVSLNNTPQQTAIFTSFTTTSLQHSYSAIIA